MFDHVTLRAGDLDASARFYDIVLRTLGVERTHTADRLIEWDAFSLSPANAEKRRRAACTSASPRPREHVDAFWQAGIDAGYADDGGPRPAPGVRARLLRRVRLRPDGDNIELEFHDRG